MITLMLVDDHTLFRKGLRALIDQNADMEVVAEAESGEEAVEAFKATHPDITLMDMRLPGMDGIQTMECLLEIDARTKVIMLSAFDFDTQVLDSIKRGAAGYLVKNLDPEELFRSINAVYLNGLGISKFHLEKLVNAARQEAGQKEAQAETDANPESSHGLSAREIEVLKLVADGMTNREIADSLCIAQNTVKAHISNIMGKLGLHKRVELATYAIGHFDCNQDQA